MRARNRQRFAFNPTTEQVERQIKRQNFWLAFQKLCEKVGATKDYWRLVKHRDADATREEKREFIRKMTRLLAFNYDVHRCPHPVLAARLKPEGAQGSEPIKYPKGWNDDRTTELEKNNDQRP